MRSQFHHVLFIAVLATTLSPFIISSIPQQLHTAAFVSVHIPRPKRWPNSLAEDKLLSRTILKRSSRCSSLSEVFHSLSNRDLDSLHPESEDDFDEEHSDENGTKHPIYWIDEIEPHINTRSLAAKNWNNLFKFLSKKSPAPYNIEAFERAKSEYERFCSEVRTDKTQKCQLATLIRKHRIDSLSFDQRGSMKETIACGLWQFAGRQNTSGARKHHTKLDVQLYRSRSRIHAFKEHVHAVCAQAYKHADSSYTLMGYLLM
jgi:hypothetical protein